MRLVFGLAATSAVLLALSLLSLGLGWRPVFAVTVFLWFSCLCATAGYAIGKLRGLAPQRHGRHLAVVAAVGLALFAAGALLSFQLTGGWPWSLKDGVLGFQSNADESAPLVVGAVLLWTVVGFFLLGDLLAWVTRNARSIRTRMVILGLASALIASIVEVRTEGGASTTVLAVVVIGLLIFGFAVVLSYRFTHRLDAVVAAMRRATGGDLDVRVSEEGRDEIAQLGRTFNEMVTGLRERQFLETAFGRYVSSDVLQKLKVGSLAPTLERREATVLYADIRGYTSLSERTTPEELMGILNTYFDAIIEVITRHGGYINKFIGDAVMVVFNAPLDQPDHADRAVRCAREMQETIGQLNAQQRFGETHELKVGIGVNTGELVAGTLGSARRAEYAVIGDPVNVAARFTSHAGAGEILIGELTARGTSLPLQSLPPVSLKGKSAPVPVFRAA